MLALVLLFGLAVLPGVTGFFCRRGPRIDREVDADRLNDSLPEAAVLRDGAAGATRWAFAALVCRLAQDGHCTLIRTYKQRWLTTGPVIAVDLHADPTCLSPIEQTVLRQLGRHDTLEGFGFAGSTFRRRTLRDVRADLVDRGWLRNRRSSSNALLVLGAGLFIGAVACTVAVDALVLSAVLCGLGTGGLVAACIRYPLTTAGARRRAAHQAYAAHSATRIQTLLPKHSE